VDFHGKLASLGADIERITEADEIFTEVQDYVSDMNA
jgi:UDP-N-acetylglucosamine 1-carboxyvinyltransferase